MSSISKIYLEMCLVITLMFSLYKLMGQSTAPKGKLGEYQMSIMHKYPHKSIGSQLFTQFEDLALYSQMSGLTFMKKIL